MEFCVLPFMEKGRTCSLIVLNKEISKYAKSQSTSKEYEYRYDSDV